MLNLEDKGPTRGVGIYHRTDLEVSLPNLKILQTDFPKETLSIVIKTDDHKGKGNMLLSVIYRSPHSDNKENEAINDFFRSTSALDYEHHLIIGDFDRKNIN